MDEIPFILQLHFIFILCLFIFFGKIILIYTAVMGRLLFLLGIIFIACASPHFQKVSNFILGGKNLRRISEHTAVHWCVCSGNFLHLLKIITSFQLSYLANNNSKQLMFSIVDIIRVQSITYLGRISLRRQETGNPQNIWHAMFFRKSDYFIFIHQR